MRQATTFLAGFDEVLQANDALNPTDRDRAQRFARDSDSSLAEAVVALGVLSEDQVYMLAADHWNLDFVFPSVDNVERELLERFPRDLLIDYTAVPLIESSDATVVAFPHRPDEEILARLQRAAGRAVRPALATHRRISQVLNRILGNDRAATAAAGAMDASGMTLFYAHLTQALECDAAMVQFQPTAEGLRVIRRGREGVTVCAVEPAGMAAPVASRARLLAHLPVPVSPTFQKGCSTLAFRGEQLKLHVSLSPTGRGDIVTVRRGEADDAPEGLAGFGLLPRDAERLTAAIAAIPKRAAGRIVLIASHDPAVRRAVCGALLEGSNVEAASIGAHAASAVSFQDAEAALATDPDVLVLGPDDTAVVVRACMERRGVLWCFAGGLRRAFAEAEAALGAGRAAWIDAGIGVHAFRRLCPVCAIPDPRPGLPDGARTATGCDACRGSGREGCEFFSEVRFAGDPDRDHHPAEHLVRQGLIAVDDAWGVA